MKKSIIIIIILFASCTSNYNKAEKAITVMARAHHELDSISKDTTYVDIDGMLAKDMIAGKKVFFDGPTGESFIHPDYIDSITDTIISKKLDQMNALIILQRKAHQEFNEAIQKMPAGKKYDLMIKFELAKKQ